MSIQGFPISTFSHCDKCGSKEATLIRYRFDGLLPEVLVIQLKRFNSIPMAHSTVLLQKIDDPIEIDR